MDANRSQNFKIEDLGIQELDVYDIEVEDNHNFFGNNILLHNSGYFSCKSVDIDLNNDEYSHKNFVEYLVNTIEPGIENYYKLLGDVTNANDIPILLEREVICKRSLFGGKKRYYWWVYESDGIIHKDDFYPKTRGYETRQSSTSVWVGGLLDKFLEKVIRREKPIHLIKFIKAAKKHFLKMPFEKIAKSVSTSKLSNYQSITTSGIPPYYKGALTYNAWLKKHDTIGKYESIKEGEKVKWIYINVNNPFKSNAIAVPGKFHPDFLNSFKIDYERQFEATVMGMVEGVFHACNWSFDDKKRLI